MAAELSTALLLAAVVPDRFQHHLRLSNAMVAFQQRIHPLGHRLVQDLLNPSHVNPPCQEQSTIQLCQPCLETAVAGASNSRAPSARCAIHLVCVANRGRVTSDL
jgi:hypothetical protein